MVFLFNFMNLKSNFYFWREQESYSVSFYFSYKTVAYDPFSEIFRNFSEFLYSGLFGYITIKLNLTFISQQKLEY
ncbi:hypothetical protein LFZ43_09715 [Salmonella enterica subsp. enterica serovar Wandsworth str. SA20092095]|nr:hypothetical protein LFZ43_09715 [Salmonella enterica subsp. enterica serovar Wandsworth str. SA20092095]